MNKLFTVAASCLTKIQSCYNWIFRSLKKFWGNYSSKKSKDLRRRRCLRLKKNPAYTALIGALVGVFVTQSVTYFYDEYKDSKGEYLACVRGKQLVADLLSNNLKQTESNLTILIQEIASVNPVEMKDAATAIDPIIPYQLEWVELLSAHPQLFKLVEASKLNTIQNVFLNSKDVTAVIRNREQYMVMTAPKRPGEVPNYFDNIGRYDGYLLKSIRALRPGLEEAKVALDGIDCNLYLLF